MSFGSWGFKSPLAHAVSYIYSPPRRRRRGVWLLAALSVAVVVFVLVTSFRSDRRVLAAYIDTAQQSAQGAAASSEEYLELVARLGEVPRQEFVTTMARIRLTSGEAGTLLDAVDVPGDAVAAHARLQLAHRSWLLGLELIEGAALAAAEDPSDEIPAELIERAIIELAVGDRAYEAGVEQLLSLEPGTDVDIPTYPVVVFSLDGGAESLIADARTSTGLKLLRDLAVTDYTLDPRALGDTNAGVGIIPFTDRLIVNVTVTNQGNEAAAEIPVQVVLSSDRTGTARSDSVSIQRLQPAESTSVEFVFDVRPVVNYEMVVNVGLTTGETEIDNNLVIFPFVVNEEG
ncbi:MAG: hypothetical protein HKN80_08680 [Acidimicrobiia bacterium]|nr:hypothetical protein [Acidimicrobiia bacterium]